jgi:uncharacterized membrane protein YphA (DoxX/SURF4 family)
MLVLLRISIGWHFLYAGIDKLETPNGFSAAGFLGQAKGPLAEKFHELIPDFEGHERLDKDKDVAAMESYLREFKSYYQLAPEQTAEVDTAFTRRKSELTSYLDDHKADLETYFHDLDRLNADKKKPDSSMPFAQKRIWDQQTKLRGQLGGWTKEIERIGGDFKTDLHDLLDKTQQERGAIPQPVTSWFTQDNIIQYSNLAIGACLIVGLFTRFSALAGGIFLLSVVAAQPDWPGIYPPPHPSAGRALIINKEFIEMMALFTLATTRVGYWAGLDFFIHHVLIRPLFGQRESR